MPSGKSEKKTSNPWTYAAGGAVTSAAATGLAVGGITSLYQNRSKNRHKTQVSELEHQIQELENKLVAQVKEHDLKLQLEVKRVDDELKKIRQKEAERRKKEPDDAMKRLMDEYNSLRTKYFDNIRKWPIVL